MEVRPLLRSFDSISARNSLKQNIQDHFFSNVLVLGFSISCSVYNSNPINLLWISGDMFFPLVQSPGLDGQAFLFTSWGSILKCPFIFYHYKGPIVIRDSNSLTFLSPNFISCPSSYENASLFFIENKRCSQDNWQLWLASLVFCPQKFLLITLEVSLLL